jgi:hypothetical protein
MVRARAFRFALRIAVSLTLVAASVVPVSAGSPVVDISTTSSPTSVTVGHVVAYPITVENMSGRTLNHVELTGSTSLDLAGSMPLDLTFLGSAPAGACPGAVCDFGQMRADDVRSVTFYYRAPATKPPNSFVFTATAVVSEGGTDSTGASHEDTFPFPITTNVLAVSDNLVRGHAFGTVPGDRIFDTGLVTSLGNPHGTKVVIPGSNVEVTVEDLPPTDGAVTCPTTLTSCFGWGSSLSVGDGGTIAGAIQVTTRWDVSQLPKGMTAKKLRVAHLTGIAPDFYTQVTGTCVFVNGVPNNMPCFEVAPFQLPDKDIQAIYWLASNRVTRGY